MCIMLSASHLSYLFFFFNDTATTEIYTLSLHDALPISLTTIGWRLVHIASCKIIYYEYAFGPGRLTFPELTIPHTATDAVDRKSTRLNSSHANISYAVFCLKKKKKKNHK